MMPDETNVYFHGDAARVVEALLENDSLDPKAFVNARSNNFEPYVPISVHGSYGTLKADPYDGTVLNYEDSPEEDREYGDIVRFDLDELRQWLQQNAPEFAKIVQPGAEFDILDVGFWTGNGEYIGAEAEHRAIKYLGAEPQ